MAQYDNEYVCCICGKTFNGYGNNPYPVSKDENAKCCDQCNLDAVIPARLMEMLQKWQ